MDWYSLRNEDEVAKKLHMSRSTLSSQKTRNSLDVKRVVQYCGDSDLNYILNGSQNAENSAIRVNEPAIDFVTEKLRDLERRATEIIDKVENGPWTPETKLKLIESLMKIVEQGLLDKETGD